MKRKRKSYSGAFKAKVGLEAVIGLKTVAQLAREYQVHPMLVSQWKGTIRDRLHELFEKPTTENASGRSERGRRRQGTISLRPLNATRPIMSDTPSFR